MLKKVWSILFVLIALSLVSCEKDADDHDHDHFEPTEWSIKNNGVVYLEIINGEISSEFNSSFLLGVNQLSEDYDILFRNEDGKIVEPDDDEYSLSWEIDDPSIAEFRFESGKEGDFEFKLFGITNGTTNLTLKVMHGDHADIISPKIPIIVQ